MSGVPSPAELVEAVREWIEGAVLPAVEGQLRFHARVAANALGIVERELIIGPTRPAASDLGFHTDAELAAAIRAGDLDDRYGEVLAALRASTRDALAIDDPSHE